MKKNIISIFLMISSLLSLSSCKSHQFEKINEETFNNAFSEFFNRENYSLKKSSFYYTKEVGEDHGQEYENYIRESCEVNELRTQEYFSYQSETTEKTIHYGKGEAHIIKNEMISLYGNFSKGNNVIYDSKEEKYKKTDIILSNFGYGFILRTISRDFSSYSINDDNLYYYITYSDLDLTTFFTGIGFENGKITYYEQYSSYGGYYTEESEIKKEQNIESYNIYEFSNIGTTSIEIPNGALSIIDSEE